MILGWSNLAAKAPELETWETVVTVKSLRSKRVTKRRRNVDDVSPHLSIKNGLPQLPRHFDSIYRRTRAHSVTSCMTFLSLASSLTVNLLSLACVGLWASVVLKLKFGLKMLGMGYDRGTLWSGGGPNFESLETNLGPSPLSIYARFDSGLVWPWPNFFIEFGMGLSPELLKILKPSLPIDLG